MSIHEQSCGALALEGDTAFALVRALRREMGLTGEAFGQMIGLSKGKVSELETGSYRCSAKVALAIEALSVVDGAARIDAGALCEDVKLARAQIISGPFDELRVSGSGSVHAPANTLNPVQDHG
jgi:DNA-binding XRE family transcriptional regulator